MDSLIQLRRTQEKILLPEDRVKNFDEITKELHSTRGCVRSFKMRTVSRCSLC